MYDLVQDLTARTEAAVDAVAHLAADTGVVFTVADVVDAVERGLPAGYPSLTMEGLDRRDIVGSMTAEILGSGKYDD